MSISTQGEGVWFHGCGLVFAPGQGVQLVKLHRQALVNPPNWQDKERILPEGVREVMQAPIEPTFAQHLRDVAVLSSQLD